MIFGKQPQLAGLYLGRAQTAAQAYLDFLEAYSCAVLQDIPVFHKELWRAFPVTERALGHSPVSYGEGAVHGDGTAYGSASADRYMKLTDGLVDIAFLVTHLGAALDLYLPSSETAKWVMVALADLYPRFPSVRYLNAFLTALVDAPVVDADGETVVEVLTAPGHCVVADRHVYPTPPGARVIVAPGDILRAGDMLTDAVKVIERTGLRDAGKQLLTGDYSRDLLFRNVSSDSWVEDGKYRFKVIGSDDDGLKFWEAADARGGLSGLGGRVNPANIIFGHIRFSA